MARIKKNDTVYVLAGKDQGKTGRVLTVFPREDRILVEGVNYVKRHTRRTSAQDQQHQGIVQKESWIHLSNVSLYCKVCKKPVRIGFNVLTDGSKVRYCKQCKETF